MRAKLYKMLAVKINARNNCIEVGNQEFADIHEDSIIELVSEYMPSGSGIDSGVSFCFEKSDGEHLVFNFVYHHMNENGFYTGWTNHVAHVTPSLTNDYYIRITGVDKNSVKEYFYQIFSDALETEIN